MRRAIFPGTFDPFTIGHYNLVKRGLELFDEIVVAIGNNSAKNRFFSIEKRKHIIETTFRNESRVKLVEYNGLTVDIAEKLNAKFILRGVRSLTDFEYEQSIADANREISGLETILLFTEPKLSFISSTIVRELYSYKHDISKLLPPNVEI